MKKSRLSFEQKWKRLVFGQDRTWRRYVIWPLLKGLGHVYGAVTAIRTALYDRGFLKRYWPGCYVVSVGNLTVGGTGKTPVVALLAEKLAKGGRKVAIVSRGYKSRKPSLKYRLKHGGDWSATRVVSDGRNVLLSPRLAGDEPYMLARNLPGVVVVTDPDRVRGGRYAMRKFGVDTLILDDGMQHLRMRRQKEVVLLDAGCPFGNRRLLPAGLLREPLAGIARADHIILTKADRLTPEGRAEIEAQVRQYNTRADIVTCHYVPGDLVSVYTGRSTDHALLGGLPVMAVTGIAQPEGFTRLLEAQGAEIVCRRFFPDHHRFTRSEIGEVQAAAALYGAQAIIVTEKDAVRFPQKQENAATALPVYYIKVALEFGEGRENLIHAVEEICCH